jgi:hypothetical protein
MRVRFLFVYVFVTSITVRFGIVYEFVTLIRVWFEIVCEFVTYKWPMKVRLFMNLLH